MDSWSRQRTEHTLESLFFNQKKNTFHWIRVYSLKLLNHISKIFSFFDKNLFILLLFPSLSNGQDNIEQSSLETHVEK